jgi:hypothetical protein
MTAYAAKLRARLAQRAARSNRVLLRCQLPMLVTFQLE